MKRLALILSGMALLLSAGPVMAQGTIAGSPHDLAGGNAGDNNEVCVYCHTPHAARTDIEAPLWNKPATGSTYTSYDSSTVDGTILAVGSVSIACLTCHDGTQGVDVVINGPGSGPGTMPSSGAANNIGTDLSNLGVDLTNDHPIGIQYGGFDPGGGVIDPDFRTTTGGYLQSASINGATRWWVNTETTPNTNRDKTDMILYTRDNGGNAQPFVECASCHDPHLGGTDNPVNFMRISNAGSAVCLACHVK